jgi:uncharacterized protein YgfB (UPF0149 family)
MSVYSEASAESLSYDQLNQDLAPLELPVQLSYLHGMLTGCLVAGSPFQAENYLRSLLMNKSGSDYRQSTNALFSILAMTQTWLTNFGFDFHLLLPNDDAPLSERVLAFADWCEGFIEGLDMGGLSLDDISNEDVLEAIQHIDEFSDIDSNDFDYNEEDEKAYFEVSEYVRLAVLQIFCDLNEEGSGRQEPVHH